MSDLIAEESVNLQFPIGSYVLHKEPNFNYQLNRTVLWGGGDLEEIRTAAAKIITTSDWERELISLGDKTLGDARIEALDQ